MERAKWIHNIGGVAIWLCMILLLMSCGECESPTTGEAEITNNYTVSTLTESFPGSGGCSVDKDGFIYVSNFGDRLDNANGTRVRIVNPQTGAIEIFAEGLSGASGSAFDSQGNLFQANIAGNSISKITPEGVTSTFATAGIVGPVGVVVDVQDNIYVCNCGGNSIQFLTPNGESSQYVSGSIFNCPNGLTIDDDGNLYAANFNDGNIIKISTDRTASVFATIPGGQNGHITRIGNVLFVIARRDNKIYQINIQDGNVQLVAGTGEAGNTDGDSAASSFYIPNGIAPSPDGTKLYVISRLVGQGPPLNPVLVRIIDLNPN